MPPPTSTRQLPEDSTGSRPALLTSRSAEVVAARRLGSPAGRRRSGQFLLEGPQAVRAAASAGLLRTLFATPEAAGRHPELRADHLLDDRALASLADAVTPQGLVGVADLITVGTQQAVGVGATLVAVCVEPRDPGNLGTIIRSADAAGADAVLVTGAAVDPHNGKCVRATAGSLFHLPIGLGDDFAGTATPLRQRGFRLIAAHGRATVDLAAAERGRQLDGPTAWVFGNEAHGLPPDVLAACDLALSVPLHGKAESLNLAAAAAVCLYASARAQRWATRPA